MENEDFYGWGLEDGERHYRWLSFATGFIGVRAVYSICLIPGSKWDVPFKDT